MSTKIVSLNVEFVTCGLNAGFPITELNTAISKVVRQANTDVDPRTPVRKSRVPVITQLDDGTDDVILAVTMGIVSEDKLIAEWNTACSTYLTR